MEKNHIITNPTLHIILDRPRIAGNIAAIARLSVATQCALHVCGPLIFDKADKTKWRAGLDYFHGARLHFHQSLTRCLSVLNLDPWLLETGGTKAPWQVKLEAGSAVVLGPENSNIEQAIIDRFNHRLLTLPQVGPVRSVNLAQCAAIGHI